METLVPHIRKPRVGKVWNFFFETYLLINRYWKEEYVGTMTPWLILMQYLLLALIIAFVNINTGTQTNIADALQSVAFKESALVGIRLAITINTVPVFISAFSVPREKEIRGRGDDHIKYGTTSVYLAKFIVLNFFRVILFVPFTAIVYPIVKSLTTLS
jgi:hypothetical protein